MLNNKSSQLDIFVPHISVLNVIQKSVNKEQKFILFLELQIVLFDHSLSDFGKNEANGDDC
jgi:hypothetical protein